LIWIEENSYYSSKDSTDYIEDIIKMEETTKIEADMKGIKVRQWLYIIIPTSLHKEKEE
jgi:hypothetical protein